MHNPYVMSFRILSERDVVGDVADSTARGVPAGFWRRHSTIGELGWLPSRKARSSRPRQRASRGGRSGKRRVGPSTAKGPIRVEGRVACVASANRRGSLARPGHARAQRRLILLRRDGVERAPPDRASRSWTCRQKGQSRPRQPRAAWRCRTSPKGLLYRP